MVFHGSEVLSGDMKEGGLVDMSSMRKPMTGVMEAHCMVASRREVDAKAGK